MSSKTKIRVGDKVKLKYGGRWRQARVIEDRGRIGMNGRRLLRVKLNLSSDVDQSFEIPESEVQPASS